MAFDNESLVKIGGQNQAQAMYTYTTADSQATVSASGYFNDAFGRLREDDYILIHNTEEDYQIRVSSSSLPITTEFLFRMSDAAQTTGWVQITDTTRTSVSPLSLVGGVRTLLNLNSDSILEIQAPSGTTANTFYNSTSKKLFGESSGDDFRTRLSYTADPATTNTNITFEIDIGGSQGVIFDDTKSLLKGSSAGNYVQLFDYYTLSTFQANGGDIYVTSNNNCDLYDMVLKISRVHKAR